MAQEIFDSIDPVISGTELAGILNDFKAALVSGLSGTVRPTELDPGGFWVDTTNDPDTWSFRLWTGSDDVEVFRIDLATGGAAVSLAIDTFSVRKISDDSNGALMDLVKRRIASSGQVLDGDVVGEIRMVGRTDTATNPVVAKIIFTADENQTATLFGGTLGFYSTPEGTNTLIEHMRFITGIIESIRAHKVNALQLVSQNVATTATIAQLSAAKAVAEMTGSTATDIQGINSAAETKQITIHNRSSAIVTLKHSNGSAAANDRMVLPGAVDVALNPEESATLIYSSADSKWKLQYLSAKFKGFTTVKCWLTANITIPVAQVRVEGRWSPKSMGVGLATTEDGTAYAWGSNSSGEIGDGTVANKSSPILVLGGIKFVKVSKGSGFNLGITEDGKAYGWGANNGGQLGDGTVVPKSSPVAVLGGIKFRDISAGGEHSVGIAEDGTAYAWGSNSGNGQLGDGTVAAKSSPVAVVGGLKFKQIFAGGFHNIGITEDGTAYGWGENFLGKLGVGDRTKRSSPVAVVGGLKFKAVASSVDGQHSMGITEDGTCYAWGDNTNGQLGDGTVVPKSSPILVLGGLKFKSIAANSYSSYGLEEDGDAYAWGDNTEFGTPIGQLGDGTVIPKSSPVAVVGGLKFRAIAGGGIFGTTATALTEAGDLYSWGGNTFVGDLGDGTFSANKSSPVAVLGGLGPYGTLAKSVHRDITVTPGSVAVTITGARAYVGGKFIGRPVEYLEITYAN